MSNSTNITIRSTITLEYLQELVRRELKLAYDDMEADDFNKAYSAATDIKLPNLEDFEDFEERIAEAKREAEADGMFEMLRDMDSEMEDFDF